MKKAAIISIGNELMTGQIVDSNAAWLSSRMIGLGVPTVHICQIGDDIDVIAGAISDAAAKAEIIIITGGLGPTDDDLTRQGIARFMETELELRQDLLEHIENFFSRRNIAMPKMNRIQACIPKGAGEIPNHTGTAPGIFAQYRGKVIAAMPGVPAEMKLMFDEFVAHRIEGFAAGQAIFVRKLKCFGAGESQLAEMLGDMMNRSRNPQVNCTVHFGVITLHIIAAATAKKIAQEMAQKDEAQIRSLLGDLVFGAEEDTLSQVLGEELAKRGRTVAVAESCTGGLIAKLITDIPGSSRYFTYGWVTYANEAKIDQLGVDPGPIKEHGAVSEEVAGAMAIGAQRKAGSDYAISVTGIAGPDGGTETKPVGLVYIGIASKADCQVHKFIFPHARELMRFRAAQTALNLLRLKIRI
jgi:nicotinamide-nucleotide amidase